MSDAITVSYKEGLKVFKKFRLLWTFWTNSCNRLSQRSSGMVRWLIRCAGRKWVAGHLVGGIALLICSIFEMQPNLWNFKKNIFIFIFNLILEREEEREVEKHWCEREALISCLLHAPQPGTKPTTQACALTGNWTGDLLVCGTMPNQLSHTGQGWNSFFPSVTKFLTMKSVSETHLYHPWRY